VKKKFLRTTVWAYTRGQCIISVAAR